MTKITIVPDVHGRSFWREAVRDIDAVPVVFLGDYLDPYLEDGISKAEALEGFRDIIALKKTHPERVTLLLGNHDLHYLLTIMGGGRTDGERFETIRDLILDNLPLFDLALELESEDHRYLFTHAGVLKGWLERHNSLQYGDYPESVGARLNYLLHEDSWRNRLLIALCETGYPRGGKNLWGSPVWADISERNPEHAELEGIYQIFGHSWGQIETITPYWACLDCEEAFTLDPETGVIDLKSQQE